MKFVRWFLILSVWAVIAAKLGVPHWLRLPAFALLLGARLLFHETFDRWRDVLGAGLTSEQRGDREP